MKKCKKCGNDFNKEDFSKLKFKQDFSGHFTDDLDLFNELTICPECFFNKNKKNTVKEDTNHSKE